MYRSLLHLPLSAKQAMDSIPFMDGWKFGRRAASRKVAVVSMQCRRSTSVATVSQIIETSLTVSARTHPTAADSPQWDDSGSIDGLLDSTGNWLAQAPRHVCHHLALFRLVRHGLRDRQLSISARNELSHKKRYIHAIVLTNLKLSRFKHFIKS